MLERSDIYNIVTIKNIDNEDFDFRVNKEPYTIKAGEIRNFPKFMAELAVKHLIDHLLNKEDTRTNNKVKREALASRIVIGENKYERPAEKSLREKVDEMNQPSDLEKILARQEVDEETLIPPPAIEDIEEVEVEEEFDGLKESPSMPSRGEMMKFASEVMGMNVEHHMVKKKLDKFSDAELYRELGMADQQP